MNYYGYPVEKSISTLSKALTKEGNAVLVAQPGAGKSTVVPLHLLEQPWLANKKILLLQPRRIAAISVANRMSELSNTSIGQEVGFIVRHHRQTSPNTRIEVITEGLLTRMIQSDPFLEGVGLVILDEFHERGIHSDLCLALCREVQKDVRPDLRILVMSATLESEPVSRFLGNCPIVEAEGFLHEVEKIHLGFDYSIGIVENTYKAIVDAFNSRLLEKCSLVFLPGRGEIENLIARLNDNRDLSEFEIMSLHGGLTLDQQKKVLNKDFGKPRIIVSTNIAETSLTIDSVSLVIDSGYCREIEMDLTSGIEGLKLKRISQASADQRAGRAGRVCSGKALRLWSHIEHQNLMEYTHPDIYKLDLAPFLLEIFLWGCSAPKEFNWFERPIDSALELGERLLKALGAIDDKNGITPLGRKMANLPVDPRLAKMILFSNNSKARQIAIVYAAFLSEKSFFRSNQPLINSVSGKSDLRYMFDLYINLINRKATPEFLTVDFRALQRIRASVKQISTKFGIVPLEEKFNFTNSDFLEAEKAVLSAFPDRVGVIRGNTNQRAYKLVDGSGYRLTNSSIVKDADMVVGLSIDKNPGASGDGKIYCAMEINPVWLEEVCPHLVAVKKEIRFDPKTASIVKERSKIFQSLVLEVNREDIQLSDQIAIESALQKEVASNIAAYFDLKNDDYLQIKFRVKLLKSYPEGEFLKNFDENWIKEKLSEFTTSCRSIRDIRAISLVERYLGELPYKQQMEFEKLVPTRYPLPSGNSAKIVYQESGAPLLKVKLQEMFGTSDTPTIINGRQSLLIQLLSPAGRPLQLTQDLKSFWENGYPLIAKEMKGKYPKHPWPDSPSTATPFGGTKKQFARKKQ